MSREPYCPMCGVVENIHSGVYCSRLSRSEALNATLRETIHALRAELEQARAVIRNTAKTVQAFRERAENEYNTWMQMGWKTLCGKYEKKIGKQIEYSEELERKMEKLREQRDRAMKVANRIADLDDEGWDCHIETIRELADEISKEKETE
jgi:DNA repair ATPase RecN